MLPTVRRSVRNIWEDPFELMQREVDRMFGRGGVAAPSAAGEQQLVGAYPVDIREDNESIYVDAEVPGFKREEIQVTLEDGMLSIAAQRKSEESDGKRGARHLHERRFTRVERSFSLPNSVEPSKVEATLSDGVLHLKLQKREEVKPHRIEVK